MENKPIFLFKASFIQSFIQKIPILLNGRESIDYDVTVVN